LSEVRLGQAGAFWL